MNQFALFSSNLGSTAHDEDAQIQINKENYAYVHACCAVFSMTSYSDNIKLNGIVFALYNWSQTEELYSKLDTETIADLQRLARYMDDEALIEKIYEKMELGKTIL